MPASNSANLGTLLRRFRYSAGLTQEALAERSGVSVRGISDMERGLRAAPHLETVRLLADGLDLVPDQRTLLLESARPESFADPFFQREQVPSVPRIAGIETLPEPLTPLVGRERVLDGISALLSGPGARLTTLTGPGGVGKTRLAVEVAGRAAPAFSDGVAFVGLAAVSDPALVTAAIAETLGVVTASGGSLARRLATVLEPRQMLLVLDNFEHLIEAAPAIVDLLAAAPRLSILVTSRTRLRLSAEHVYRVPGLDVPGMADSAAQLDKNESLRLFVDRAQAVEPEFALSDAERGHLAEICRRLDGIPLAIALAASRVNLLPVAEIAIRIERPLPFLTGGSRDFPDRQRSIRDTIAWSYGLLTSDEQSLLRWLSPFVGGFALGAAEATALIAGLPPHQTLDLVSALVDSALVVPTHTTGASPRFHMLETIREFGLEQLAEAGELDEAQLAHARHFLAFASHGAPAPSEHQDLAWVHRLAVERDNLVSAFDRVCQPEHAVLCLQFAAALGPYWDIHGPYEEGWARLQRAIALALPEPSFVKGRVCYWGALLGGWRKDYPDAVAIADAGISNAEALADATTLAEAVHIRALLELFQHHWGAAATLFERELELWEGLDNPFAQARSLHYLGGANYGNGDLPHARVHIERAAQLFHATGFPEWIAPCDWYFGLFAVAEERFAAAAVSFEQSLRNWLVDDIPSGEFKPIVGLADVAAALGLPEHAGRMLGAMDHILETTDGNLMSFDLPGYERATASSRSALTPARFAACFDEGRRLRPDELLAEGGAIVAAASGID